METPHCPQNPIKTAPKILGRYFLPAILLILDFPYYFEKSLSACFCHGELFHCNVTAVSDGRDFMFDRKLATVIFTIAYAVCSIFARRYFKSRCVGEMS